jgi:hypothetical protein
MKKGKDLKNMIELIEWKLKGILENKSF